MLATSAPKCFRNAFSKHAAPPLTWTIMKHQQRGITSNNDHSTSKIPDFSKYSSKGHPRSNQVFSYFMAGSLGLASAVGAKATVQGMVCVRSSWNFLMADWRRQIQIFWWTCPPLPMFWRRPRWRWALGRSPKAKMHVPCWNLNHFRGGILS